MTEQDILPNEGFVTFKQIKKVYPVSRSSWWDGIKTGEFPKPCKLLKGRSNGWDVDDIRALIERKKQAKK